MPDAEAISLHVRQAADLAEARRGAEKRLAEARRVVATEEAALAKREVEAKGATHADWIAARATRDAGLNRLDDALEGAAAARREHFDAALSLVSAADGIAEAVISDSARAARLQAAREDLAARRGDLSRAEAEAAGLEAASAAALAEWRAAWTASAIAPHAPAEMARWRERAVAALARRAELAKRRAEIAALAAGLEDARAALAQALAAHGLDAAPSFDLAYREARLHLDAMRKAWNNSRDVEFARTRAIKDLRDAEAALTRESDALEALLGYWPDAMAGLRLGPGASIVQAEAALEVWRGVALPRQNMTQEARRIEGIERDLASFEAGVDAIVRACAPSLAGARADEALVKLTALLAEARRADDARAAWRNPSPRASSANAAWRRGAKGSAEPRGSLVPARRR